MFFRRGSESFISNKGKIVAPGEISHPIVHRVYDGTNAESFIAQHLADSLLPQFDWSIWISPCYLQIEGHEAIARVPREQNNLCPAKLPARDQIFAPQSVPEIAFCAVLEQIVRKNQPGNTRLTVTFRTQRESTSEALAEVRAHKCTKPGAPAFRDRNDDGRPSGKFSCAAAKIAARPSRGGMPKSRSRRRFISGRQSRERSRQAFLLSGCPLRLGSGQRLRCDVDSHSAVHQGGSGCCIKLQNGVSVQAQSSFGGV